MKKCYLIICLLLSAVFYAEMISGFLPQGETVNYECAADAKEEKKPTDDYKIINTPQEAVNITGFAVTYPVFNAPLPRSSYCEISLPPPDAFC